jgi:BCD family chlorophyll transporter-like MFS transporter
VALAPQVVFLIPEQPILGLLVSLVVFAAWGMGFNISSVAYISLASELSGEKGRSRTVGVMWFLMIVGIIVTAATLSRLLREYSPDTLRIAFEYVALAALGLGMLGLFRLEPRSKPGQVSAAHPFAQRASWQDLIRGVLANPQARHFFLYMIILLAAILGQDVLLEPYAGEAFALRVDQTTRITSIWGGCMLVALLTASFLEKRLSKKRVAGLGALIAIAGFILIAGSGPFGLRSVFYAGVVLLGIGSGFSTVSNLSLMLDMTTARVGLYIGAWGVAEALARGVGTLTAGVLRDALGTLSKNPLTGYLGVFVVQAGLMVISIFMLARIDVSRFRQTAQPDLGERAAMMSD